MFEQSGRPGSCLYYLHLLNTDINALKLPIEGVNSGRILGEELDYVLVGKIGTINQNISENGLCCL